MLYLKEANFENMEKEYLFVREIPADESGFTNPWPGVSREDFAQTALLQMIAASKAENVPACYVPQTSLFLWEDDEIVGLFRIRHYLNDSLQNGAGHIGYFIKKEYRGKG